MQFKKIAIVKEQPSSKTKKRRFYTRNEREAFLKQWQSSGLNQEEFCKQNNLSTKSFYRWRCQYPTLDKEQISMSLANEVNKKNKEVAENEATIEKKRFKLECSFPNGATFVFKDGLDELGLSYLLKEIMQCKFN